MEEKVIILANIDAGILELRRLNPEFMAAVSEDYEELSQKFLIPRRPTKECTDYDLAFYERAFSICKQLTTLCPVTAKNLPPLVSHQSHPDWFKQMTVVRMAAWLIKISKQGQKGFFRVDTREAAERAADEVKAVPFVEDMTATNKQIICYIRETVEDYVEGTTFPDYDEMIDTHFTPTPRWWNERYERLSRTAYRKTSGDTGDDF